MKKYIRLPDRDRSQILKLYNHISDICKSNGRYVLSGSLKRCCSYLFISVKIVRFHVLSNVCQVKYLPAPHPVLNSRVRIRLDLRLGLGSELIN